MDNDSYVFPLLLPLHGGANPGELSRVWPPLRLVFHRRTPEVFRCMSCAEAGLDWNGPECEMREHASQHQDMLNWALYLLWGRGLVS
jgi:hypothetical protein